MTAVVGAADGMNEVVGDGGALCYPDDNGNADDDDADSDVVGFNQMKTK